MLDEPATAFALAGFLLRALDCGAVDAAEVHAAGGPDEPALRRLARRTAAGVPLDALSAAELREVLHEVCASPRWVDEVAAAAPYGDVDTLLAAAELALAVLDERDIDDALAGHPRIGERSEARLVGCWSRRAWATTYGQHWRPATGSTRPGSATSTWSRPAAAPARSCWPSCGERLNNDPAQERAVVREELGAINRLRLQRLVEEQ